MFGSLPHIATPQQHTPQHSIATAQYVVFSAKAVAVILLATSCGTPQFGVATGGRQPSRLLHLPVNSYTKFIGLNVLLLLSNLLHWIYV
jgi:hypothetical protein